MDRLDRRIGQRTVATRAPSQARNGWRPSGRLLVTPHHLRDGQILSDLWGPPQRKGVNTQHSFLQFLSRTALGIGRSFFPLLAITIIVGTALWGPWVSLALTLVAFIAALRFL